jgi:hypothetical protein
LRVLSVAYDRSPCFTLNLFVGSCD